MPEKKKTAKGTPTRPRSKSTSRKSGRSKSAGRDTVRSPAPKPRSRSRSKTPSRSTRAPASDSKIRKRDTSGSPDSDRSSVRRSRATKTESSQTLTITTTTTRNHIAAKLQESSKQTEPLINETSQEKFTPTVKNIGLINKISNSIILSVIGYLLYFITFTTSHFWLNSKVFAPVKEVGTNGGKLETTLWGVSCSFLGVYWPRDWHVYFDLPCILFVFAFVFCQYLFARFIPFGKLIASNLSNKRADHRTNGPIVFFVTLAIFSACEFTEYAKLKGFKPSTFIPGHLIGLQIATHLLAFAMSVGSYYLFRSTTRQTRQSSNPSNFMDNFVNGRQSRPSLAGVDWKVVTTRTRLLNLVMLMTCYGHIHWERANEQMNPSLLTMLLMHFVYIITFFFSESCYLSSHNGQTELFGYKFIMDCLCAPFFYSLAVAYYVVYPDANKLSRSACNYYTITLAGLFFMLGMWIFFASNKQKDRFKREPNHPSVANLETIGGSGSQRLLAGGWWGLVRHPNYLGDVLINLSFGICCGFENPLLWVPAVISCTRLFYRIVVTESHSAKKYGALWQKYTNLVPYRLVPKVY